MSNTKEDELREALEDVVWQFARRCHSDKDKRKWLHTDGFASLENAFDTLGWSDPHYVEDGGCEYPGCYAWDACGMPMKNGYKRLCYKHYAEVNNE
jgi:hypothetical protein